MIAKVDLSTLAVTALAAKNGGIESDMIPFGESGTRRTQECDDARCFMPHHNRRYTAAGGPIVSMHIAAANPARRDANQNLIRARHGSGHFGYFKVPILREY